MAFGHSSRSKRSSSPKPPPKPPRPNQRESAIGVPQKYVHPPYASPAGAYSNNTFQTPTVPYNPNMTMSTVHLQPQQAPQPLHHFPGTALSSPPWNSQPPKPSKWTSCTNLNQSMTNLVSHTVEKTNATILDLENLVYQSLGGGANVKEATSRLLDQVITSIDLGSFCGRENELSKWYSSDRIIEMILIRDNSCCVYNSFPVRREERSPITAKREEANRVCGLLLQGVSVCQFAVTTSFNTIEIVRPPTL